LEEEQIKSVLFGANYMHAAANKWRKSSGEYFNIIIRASPRSLHFSDFTQSWQYFLNSTIDAK